MLNYRESAHQPEPVQAGEDERPTHGRWYKHCSSCLRLTSWAPFMDAHGCDLGGGCTECRYIFNYRGCRYAARRTA